MARSGSHRVVVVEDNEFLAAALRDLLESAGYEVRVARSMRTAVRALTEHAGPCIVLIDPLVPGISPARLSTSLGEHQALMTIAVAIFPVNGNGGPPQDRRRTKRLVSTEVLLQ